MLIKSLTPPFREAIEATRSLILPSLDAHNPPPAFDPASVKSRRRFLIRRTKLLVNLITWHKAVGEVPEIDELVRKLLVDVMLPIAQTGWDVGGQEIMSKVNVLPVASHHILISPLKGQGIVTEGNGETGMGKTAAMITLNIVEETTCLGPMISMDGNISLASRHSLSRGARFCGVPDTASQNNRSRVHS